MFVCVWTLLETTDRIRCSPFLRRVILEAVINTMRLQKDTTVVTVNLYKQNNPIFWLLTTCLDWRDPRKTTNYSWRTKSWKTVKRVTIPPTWTQCWHTILKPAEFPWFRCTTQRRGPRAKKRSSMGRPTTRDLRSAPGGVEHGVTKKCDSFQGNHMRSKWGLVKF